MNVRSRVVGAVSVLVGFGLAWYVHGLESDRAARAPGQSIAHVQAELTRVRQNEAASPHVADSTGAPALGDVAGAATLFINVVARETGEPLAGAAISLFPAASEPTSIRSLDRALGRGESAQNGSLNLALENFEGKATLRVDSLGYLPFEINIGWQSVIESETDPLEIALDPGQSIQGRIVDVSGQGVPGVRVAVVTPDLPSDIGRESAVSAAGGSYIRTTLSGLDGVFLVSGLRSGRHRIVLAEDGWQIVPSRNLDDPARRFMNRSVVNAGDSNAVIRVEMIRAYRVKIVDASSGAPVDDRFAMVVPHALPSGGPIYAAGERFVSFERLPFRTRDAGMARPAGTYVGLVAFAPSANPPDQLTVTIQAIGCRVSRATIRLVSPGELQSSDFADLIRIEPTGPYASAGALSIVARRATTGDPIDALKGPAAYVTGTCSGAPLGFHLPSSREGGRYTFARLPAGHLKLRFSDGLSSSDWFDVVLSAGEALETELALPDPTGVVIDLRGPTGERVFSADAVAFSAGDDPNATLLFAGATRFLGFRSAQEVRNLVPFDPGTYTIHASKTGLGTGTATVEVARGRISVARIQLSSE